MSETQIVLSEEFVSAVGEAVQAELSTPDESIAVTEIFQRLFQRLVRQEAVVSLLSEHTASTSVYYDDEQYFVRLAARYFVNEEGMLVVVPYWARIISKRFAPTDSE